jgi:glycine/D-amino acid oxidase-like deaminating enzyme
MGVDLFFVISGFLITGILLDVRSEASRFYYGGFYARRMLRILPPYVLILVALVAFPSLTGQTRQAHLLLTGHEAWYWTLLVNVLIASYGWAAVIPQTAPLWSLAVEEQFYLIWPSVVRRLSPRGVLRLGLVLIVVAGLVRALLAGRGLSAISLYVLMPTRADTLAWGAVLAALVRLPNGMSTIRSALWPALLVASSVLILVMLRFQSSYYWSVPMVIAGYPAVAMAAACLVVIAIVREPGVVRARRAVHAVAAAFEKLGGEIVIGRATPSKVTDGRLEEIALDTGTTLRADTFVYAVGAWLGKDFPDLFAKKMRVPLGYVCYFGTPVGDYRFTYPNLPSFNFPGVTGWPALPVDNRGFRVRGSERAPTPPQTLASAGATQNPSAPAIDTGSNAANAAGPRQSGQAQADVPPQQLDPDTSDRWANQERVDGSRRFVAHRFPLLKEAPIAQTHACHYEITSSGDFIVDKHPQMTNVWIAAGGNAEGFKFGPKIGDYVAQRVLGVWPDPSVDQHFKVPAKEFEPPKPAADTTRRKD